MPPRRARPQGFCGLHLCGVQRVVSGWWCEGRCEQCDSEECPSPGVKCTPLEALAQSIRPKYTGQKSLNQGLEGLVGGLPNMPVLPAINEMASFGKVSSSPLVLSQNPQLSVFLCDDDVRDNESLAIDVRTELLEIATKQPLTFFLF